MTKTNSKVVVVGASGFGRECLDVLEAIIEFDGSIEIIGVLDDSPSETNLARLEARSIQYLGTVDDYLQNASTEIQFVVAIGNPKIRESVVKKFTSKNLRPYSAIHPSAIIGSQVVIGDGVVICAGAILSTNVFIDRYVHLNPGVIVGHDSRLDSFVSINPGAVISGEVNIETGVLVGASSLVLQQLRVGSKSIIGAGAVVTRNVPHAVIVKGIPGRWEI